MKSTDRDGHGLGATLVLGAMAAYRTALAPIIGGTCRFWPPCSAYAEEAVRHHGAWRGGVLTVKRLARCRPFGPFGYDPVPMTGDGHETCQDQPPAEGSGC